MKMDSSNVKKGVIATMVLVIADVVKDIYIYIKGRKKGHKDCATAMSEAGKTIKGLKKENAELRKGKEEKEK